MSDITLIYVKENKMEAGTKLKCIDDTGVEGGITKGEIYYLVELDDEFADVKDNTGKVRGYFIDRFEVVKEYNQESEEEITLKLTPIEANTLLGLMTLTEGDREFSLRKHILSISQKLSDRFTSNHEDLMEFTTHLQDDMIQIEFRNFNVVNEIKSVEKQIDNLKHKLEQLKGE